MARLLHFTLPKTKARFSRFRYHSGNRTRSTRRCNPPFSDRNNSAATWQSLAYGCPAPALTDGRSKMLSAATRRAAVSNASARAFCTLLLPLAQREQDQALGNAISVFSRAQRPFQGLQLPHAVHFGLHFRFSRMRSRKRRHVPRTTVLLIIASHMRSPFASDLGANRHTSVTLPPGANSSHAQALRKSDTQPFGNAHLLGNLSRGLKFSRSTIKISNQFICRVKQ